MERVTLRLLILGWMLFSGLVAHAQSIGDSPAAVTAKLGEPTMKRTAGNRETWIYPGGKKLVFVQGKLAESEVNQAEAHAAAAANRRAQAQRDIESIRDDFLPVGKQRVPMRNVVIALVIVAVATHLTTGRFDAKNRKAGASLLGVAFVLHLGCSIGMGLLVYNLVSNLQIPGFDQAAGYIKAGLLLRNGLFLALMIFMWRGSSWAFGIFVLLAAVGVALDLLRAYVLKMWSPLLPTGLNITVVALLLSASVQGFLDRHARSVKETIREVDLARQQRGRSG